MDRSNEGGKGKAVHAEEASLAMVPVSTPGFIQQARIPGMQVQRRNNSPTTMVSQNTEIIQAKTLIPVNIKQIWDSWAARRYNYIVINNNMVSSVKVIGQVRGKQMDEYKGTFRMQDCSGEINASIWFTCGRQEFDKIPEGAYAAAVGRVKIDGNSPELQCYDCRPVKNFNDITHHHLSVIATHIDSVLMPEKSVHQRVAEMWAEDMAASSSKESPGQEGSNAIFAPKQEILSQEITGLNIAEAELSIMSTDRTADQIVKILREETLKVGPGGVHVLFLCAKLKIPKETIRAKLDILAADGEVYTTIDADHYAPT